MSLLDELLPQAIVLYDPDTQFVREIEVHQVGEAGHQQWQPHHDAPEAARW